MIKRKLIRGISIIAVGVMVGHNILAKEIPTQQWGEEENIQTIVEDTLGSGARLIISEEEQWPKVGENGEYNIKLVDVPLSVFAQDGSLVLYIEIDKDNILQGGFQAETNTQVNISKGLKHVESNFEIASNGSLRLKINELDREGVVTIESKGLKIDVGRTNPEGYYNLNAISQGMIGEEPILSFKDAFIIWTPATGTTSYINFFIGEKKYETNMVKGGANTITEIEIATYYNQQKIAMVPAKYALQNQIKNFSMSQGIIRFIYNEKEIELNLKSKIAIINQDKYTLAAIPEIKEGKLFISAEDIAYFRGGYWEVEQGKQENKIVICNRWC